MNFIFVMRDYYADTKIVLDSDWLIPGDMNNEGTLKIAGKPIKEGAGFIYPVTNLSYDFHPFWFVTYQSGHVFYSNDEGLFIISLGPDSITIRKGKQHYIFGFTKENSYLLESLCSPDEVLQEMAFEILKEQQNGILL